MMAAQANYDAPTRAVLGILLILTTLCVAGRAAARYVRKARLEADDVLAYLTYLINTGQLICGFIAVELGYTNAQAMKHITPGNLKFLTRNMTALGLLYLMALIPMKLSVLFLHRRIFTLNVTWVRYYWWFNFLLVFPCWTVITFTLFGIIFNPLGAPKQLTNSVTPLVGSMNAASDLLILVLPVASIRGLQMSRRSKYQLYAIFSLALLACALSIFRMTIIEVRIRHKSNNIAHDHLVNICATASETSVGFMCVCLPIVKPVLQRISGYVNTGYSEISKRVLALRQSMRSKHLAKTRTSTQLDDSSVVHLQPNQIQQTKEYKVDTVRTNEVSEESVHWQGQHWAGSGNSS